MCHIGDISINNAKCDKIFINLLMAFCEALMVLFGPNDHQHGSWNQMRSPRTPELVNTRQQCKHFLETYRDQSL